LNRSTFALFVALLIHILLLLLFWILGNQASHIKKEIKPKENRVKVSLKEYKPKKAKNSGDTKKKIKPSPIAPPMPKGGQLKKVIKRPPVKYEPKKAVKKPKLNPKPKPKVVKPKPKPQPKVEPLPPQKPYIPLTKAKTDINTTKKVVKKKKENPLYALLSEDKSNEEQKQQKSRNTAGSNIGQDIKELYGDEFGKLTPGQQKYILDNQEIMRRITQQVLSRVARVNLPRDLNVNRTNVIEFYLHPNGDMTDFKFIKKSGYYVLDDTTKETIEYAYSRYPRPKEKTLIRYNVFYNLARY